MLARRHTLPIPRLFVYEPDLLIGGRDVLESAGIELVD